MMLGLRDKALKRLNETTHRLHSLPVLVLMPHSRCNCRCVMCDIWRANQQKREITAEQFEPHLADLRRLRVRWVVLSGGEPLMHSNLWRLCEQIHGLGARISLLSTGLLLARHAESICRWCDDVIVSLDGPREIHDEIRRIPRAFDQLADGVAALRAVDPKFRVTGRSVVQRRNFDRLAETARAARDIGLDQISFLAADVSSEAFNRPGGWDSERVDDVALSAPQADELADTVERLIVDHAADIETEFIAESANKLRRIGLYYRSLHGAATLPPPRCNAPWVSAVIESDGTVLPCFFHDAYGHLDDGTLDDIVNSDAARDFRRQLDVAHDPICQRCVCSLNL